MDQRLPDALDHLQEALAIASDLGLAPDAAGIEQRVEALARRIADLEPTKTTVISSTLSQAGFFDELVREQVSRAEIAAAHLGFAEALADFLAMLEPLQAVGQDARPPEVDASEIWGPAADRFAEIEASYVAIGAGATTEIEREHMVHEAYGEFRAALKGVEAISLELLETAFARYNTARQKLLDDEPSNGDEEQAPLAERLRQLQDEERRWGVARDVANRVIAANGAAEIVRGRLTQSTTGKERLYWQSQAFIGAVSTILEALPRLAGEGTDPEQQGEAVRSLCLSIELFQMRTRETVEEVERLAGEAAEEIAELQADSEERLQRLTPPRSA